MITEYIPFLFNSLKDTFTLLASMSVVTGTIIAYRAIGNYTKQKRYEAILKLIGEIESSNNYIAEIISNPDQYQYEGYYPFSIPEISEARHNEKHQERSYRLIYNEANKLNKNAWYLIPQIRQYEEPLHALIKDFNNTTNEARSLIAHINFSQSDDIKTKYLSREEYASRLIDITGRAKELLQEIAGKYRV